ncbi:hypothetical protein A1O3_04031 [Capronia epimyces CBS 606.96]|uniref:Hsp70-like protein n=1 Tax=Capronia epimyces CBS 606.96 TaxID=1182542 RepID=W9Y3J8_9EURO|nr:uncharacterized protein A1O3_04031 [Capronia epimyces CBS 606.96]EXJ87073.1 hypothetical protein A1O3_04031 [Capronia epimyces CBS 606.96]
MPSNILGIKDTVPRDDELKARTPIKSPALKRKKSTCPLSPEEAERKRELKEALEQRRAEKNSRIVVGIDFGTTFSGAAYGSTTKSWNDVVVISRWPGERNDILEKVPTRLAYGIENQSSTDKWGYDVGSGQNTCQWFKLLLDGALNKTDFDDPLLERSMGSSLMHLPEDKTAMEVASDFLSKLYCHVMDSIQQVIGRVAVEKTAIRFVVTTPATWSLAARQATREAAEDADIGSRDRDDIVMIDEPEAAAIYAIKSTMSAFDARPFLPNTCIMVVDMGGGTCDLSTYRLVRIDPLQIEEACVGQGGKCGGTWIDRNLNKLLEERFGRAFSELPLSKTGAGSRFMAAFESVKRNFSNEVDAEKVFELPLKMRKLDEDDPVVAASYDFDEDMVKITAADVEDMFEPVVTTTFDLVDKQLSRTKEAKMPPVRAMVLCGGVGSSPYVRHRFEKYIDENLKSKVELVSPQRPWSAIVRGAVIANLEKSPVSFRRCCDSIGFTVHQQFDPSKHNPADQFECPELGLRARNQMCWSVLRGEKVSTNLKKQVKCYLVIQDPEVVKEEHLVYQDVYACDKKLAPQRLDTSVRRIGRLKFDLTSLVKSEQNRIDNDTGEYPANFNFDVCLEMTLGSQKGTLELAAKSGRKRLGSVTIEYESDAAYNNGVKVSGK